jgi:phenylalanyl-tRNA synthetase beta chain
VLLSQKCVEEYLDIKIVPEEYADKMTMTGSKVESITSLGAEIENVVVGLVKDIYRHQNSDHLWIYKIDVGAGNEIQIVTGAQNVTAGDMVPVALNGARLPDDIVIESGELRGELSQGMLCSLSELGLTTHDYPYASNDGIFILQEEACPGDDIRTVLGMDDVVFDFEITSNRPDCNSIIGLARETAATYGISYRERAPKIQVETGSIDGILYSEILNPDLCPRYSNKIIQNVKIAPSPSWLRQRLRTLGVRPINNIVDITNYVMLEYGQPMHAFNIDFIKGRRITVRNAHAGERITTLDEQERALSPEMLVIADAERAIAIAGVMGGANSEISDDTTTVVFESANFNGPSVRATAKKLGMRTDASSRYEKGLDPELTYPALIRACELVEQLGCGEVVGGILDLYPNKPERRTLPLDVEWINRFLNTNISKDKMVKMLTLLSFEVQPDNTVVIPSFRSDVEGRADLSEEIARLYGYDKILTTNLRGESIIGGLTSEQEARKTIRATLNGLGYDEIITYSFIDPKAYDKIRLPDDAPFRNSIAIANPLGEETSIMRTTLLPSFLEILSKNYYNRNLQVNLFEIGTVYYPTERSDTLPTECRKIILGGYGSESFLDLKGSVEALLEQFRVFDIATLPTKKHPSFHPGQCGEISASGQVIGVIGTLHPTVMKNFDMDIDAYAAILDINSILSLSAPEPEYCPLPRFPSVQRDLAFICAEEIPVGQLNETIQANGGVHLVEVALFDIYKGKQIPDGMKSVAFTLLFRAPDRTLKDEEINRDVDNVLSALKTKFQAQLRT